MASKHLLVTSGDGRKAAFPITEPVSRVGSAAGMHICIAELPPHALTLRIRGGEIFAFNRSDRQIKLDNVPLAPGASVCCRDGQTLRVGSVELEVEYDTAAARKRRPHHAGEGGEATDEIVSEEERKQARSQRKLLIYGFFMMFGAYLFLNPNNAQSSTTSAEFDVLINALMSAPSDARLQNICISIQRAYNNDTLGNLELATAEYDEVRRILLRNRRNNDPLAAVDAVRDAERIALRFVRQRIEWLR